MKSRQYVTLKLKLQQQKLIVPRISVFQVQIFKIGQETKVDGDKNRLSVFGNLILHDKERKASGWSVKQEIKPRIRARGFARDKRDESPACPSWHQNHAEFQIKSPGR